MQERGWDIGYVGGTSMGSVIAAEFALGWTIEEMIERNGRSFRSAPISRDVTLPVVALGRGRSSTNLLQELFADIRIEDCPVPFFCVSCNLSQAAQVVHEHGPICLWTRASSSVPGIVPPVPLAGDLLVDGGVLNNLPADVMRHRCTGPVVAVDVSSQVVLRTELADETSVTSGLPLLGRRLARRGKGGAGIGQILARSSTVTSVQNLAVIRAHCDLYLRPPVGDVSPFDFDAIDRVAEIGYKYTEEKLALWEAAGRPVHGDDAALAREVPRERAGPM
jgi:predicted acylesterase/phospholipase RssA